MDKKEETHVIELLKSMKGVEMQMRFKHFEPFESGVCLDGYAELRIVEPKINEKRKSERGTCEMSLFEKDEAVLKMIVDSSRKEIVLKKAKILWLIKNISFLRALLSIRASMRKKHHSKYKVRISSSLISSVFSSNKSKNNHEQYE